MADRERREQIYDGQLFLYSPTAASRAFCEFTRGMPEEAFAPHEPRDAQHHMPVEEYVPRASGC